MEPVEFILQTIRHMARDEGAPPPGIPTHAGADFEAELVRICEESGTAPLVIDSLERLALEPALSRVSLERLGLAASSIRDETHRNIALAAKLSETLRERGIRHAFVGEVASALFLYSEPALRRVRVVELLVDESDWHELEMALGDLGLVQPMQVPGLAAGREALEFFQFFSPCLFGDDSGRRVRLRFRLVDFGPPGEREWMLEETGAGGSHGAELRLVPPEGLLIASVLGFGLGRRIDLGLLADIALLCGRGLDWKRVGMEVRRRRIAGGFDAMLDYALERASLRLPTIPRSRRRSLKRFLYEPPRESWSGEGACGRRTVRFYLVHADGVRRRALMLGKLLCPRKSWASTFFGKPCSLYLRIRFILLALSGRTQEIGLGFGARESAAPGAERAGRKRDLDEA